MTKINLLDVVMFDYDSVCSHFTTEWGREWVCLRKSSTLSLAESWKITSRITIIGNTELAKIILETALPVNFLSYKVILSVFFNPVVFSITYKWKYTDRLFLYHNVTQKVEMLGFILDLLDLQSIQLRTDSLTSQYLHFFFWKLGIITYLVFGICEAK